MFTGLTYLQTVRCCLHNTAVQSSSLTPNAQGIFEFYITLKGQMVPCVRPWTSFKHCLVLQIIVAVPTAWPKV